jgi:hypothetical protein
MARDRTVEQDRQALLEAAERLTGTAQDELAVLVVRGIVEIVRAVAPPVRPGAPPADMSAYDAAIYNAAGDNPMSSRRLAARAGHRDNSYFRERLARLVDAGHIRYTRRGYVRPGR